MLAFSDETIALFQYGIVNKILVREIKSGNDKKDYFKKIIKAEFEPKKNESRGQYGK